MWGSETAETNLRTMLFPCYLQLLGVDVGERDCGDESADAAVTVTIQGCTEDNFEYKRQLSSVAAVVCMKSLRM